MPAVRKEYQLCARCARKICRRPRVHNRIVLGVEDEQLCAVDGSGLVHGIIESSGFYFIPIAYRTPIGVAKRRMGEFF